MTATSTVSGVGRHTYGGDFNAYGVVAAVTLEWPGQAAMSYAWGLLWTTALVAACCFVIAVVVRGAAYGSQVHVAALRMRTSLAVFLSRASLTQYELIALGLLMLPSIILLCCLTIFEDELLDTIVLGLSAVVIVTFCGVLWSTGGLFAFLLTPAGNPDAWRRLALVDALNFGLCVFRVTLCWVRYVFYDAQVEWIDMILGHTDEVSCLSITGSMAATTGVVWPVVSAVIDMTFMVFIVLLSCAKLGLALFLMGLVIDLFVLRPTSRAMTRWHIDVRHEQERV
jgi:hypothetical protein